MKRFEFVDITTADVAFIANGKDLNELFENSALAMFEVIINTKQINPKVEKTVKVKAQDLNSLLFAWLNALLVYVDSENLVFSEFQTKVDGKKFELTAVCKGEEINLKKHEIRTAVKSATYHKMEI
ncbi:MAG: archease, partial [Candidatus Aenigmatarchaeota archaeon]